MACSIFKAVTGSSVRNCLTADNGLPGGMLSSIHVTLSLDDDDEDDDDDWLRRRRVKPAAAGAGGPKSKANIGGCTAGPVSAKLTRVGDVVVLHVAFVCLVLLSCNNRAARAARMSSVRLAYTIKSMEPAPTATPLPTSSVQNAGFDPCSGNAAAASNIPATHSSKGSQFGGMGWAAARFVGSYNGNNDVIWGGACVLV